MKHTSWHSRDIPSPISSLYCTSRKSPRRPGWSPWPRQTGITAAVWSWVPDTIPVLPVHTSFSAGPPWTSHRLEPLTVLMWEPFQFVGLQVQSLRTKALYHLPTCRLLLLLLAFTMVSGIFEMQEWQEAALPCGCPLVPVECLMPLCCFVVSRSVWVCSPIRLSVRKRLSFKNQELLASPPVTQTFL